MVIIVQRFANGRALGRRFTTGPLDRDLNDIMDEVAETAFLRGTVTKMSDLQSISTEIFWFDEHGIERRRVSITPDPASRKTPGTNKSGWWLKELMS